MSITFILGWLVSFILMGAIADNAVLPNDLSARPEYRGLRGKTFALSDRDYYLYSDDQGYFIEPAEQFVTSRTKKLGRLDRSTAVTVISIRRRTERLYYVDYPVVSFIDNTTSRRIVARAGFHFLPGLTDDKLGQPHALEPGR